MPHPFDQLEFSGFAWRTDIYSELLQADVELIVEAEQHKPPEPWQRQVYDRLVTLPPRLQLPVLRTILSEISVTHPADAIPQTLDALARAIRPTGIVISQSSENDAEIGLLYECDWDPGHGLGVRLARWQIDEVGAQDVCF